MWVPTPVFSSLKRNEKVASELKGIVFFFFKLGVFPFPY